MSLEDSKYSIDSLKKAIKAFGEAPDSQLDPNLSKECREFFDTNDGDPVRFLRNLQDKCVRYAGGSSVIIQAISLFLSGFPEETEDIKTQRRNQIRDSE